MGNKGSFQKHIAGLRAVAIVLILLFHLNGQAWSQGYLGVDIFLVITGYLLILGGKKQEQAWGARDAAVYLGKRFRRIVPPMAGIIIITVGLGAVMLASTDEWLVSSVGWSACMARANTYLAKLMSNYFAPDAAFNPLLHLWYLSIMLQVYAMAALAIPLMQRMKKGWVMVSLGGAACASFGWWLWHNEAYYDTLPRMWEILAGGLVCILPQGKRAWATAASAVSLGYILLSGLGIVTGIIPAVVASAVLIIRYLPESHLMRLLSNQPMQWIGKISFSLYLVHMPLFVYWRMWLFGEVGAWDEALMLIAAVPLGWLYYQLVEKRRPAWWAVVAIWLCALALSYAGRKTHGFKKLLSESAPVPVQEYTVFRECTEDAMSAAAEPLLNPYCDSLPGKVKLRSPLLWLGDGTHTPNVLMIGDSHASHLYAGMNELFLQEGYSGLLMSTIVLPFKGWSIEWNADGSYYYNPQKEAALLRWLEAHPQIKHVIITQRWIYRWDHEPDHEKFATDLRLFLQALRQLDKHAIVIGPTPEYGPRFTREDKYGKLALLRGIQRSGATVSITQTAQQYLRTHAPALSVLRMLRDEGLCTLVEPLHTLAPGEVFRSMEDGILMMHDDSHFSAAGSIRMTRRLLPQIRKALDTPPPSAQD